MNGAPRLRLAPLWWVLGLALVAVVIAGTLAPPSDLPHVVDELPDKLEHFGAYFGMSLWFAGLVRRSRYAALAGIFLALGASLEGGQYLMHVGRDADWFDMLANACGVFAGLALACAGFSRWPAVIERGLGLATGAS